MLEHATCARVHLNACRIWQEIAQSPSDFLFWGEFKSDKFFFSSFTSIKTNKTSRRRFGQVFLCHRRQAINYSKRKQILLFMSCAKIMHLRNEREMIRDSLALYVCLRRLGCSACDMHRLVN